MAFRVPAQAPRRASYQVPRSPSPSAALELPSPFSEIPPKEPTEWVLFSPSRAPSVAAARTASTERIPRTAGSSRLSDFGSFATALHSDGDEHPAYLEGDEAELDSLDDGLHAFREPWVGRAGTAHLDGTHIMLPAHDGLGSFHASSPAVQDQLWQHEHYNPSRRVELRPRRRSSVQRRLDAVAENEESQLEQDRRLRIEQWRIDQSRALLQEIEQGSRRRRKSRGNLSRSTTVTHSEVSETPRERDAETCSESEAQAEESYWRRITRKVIRDLIGIDESLLSVILGESLPLEAIEEAECLERQRQEYGEEMHGNLHVHHALGQILDSSEPNPISWHRFLQRIARELGILVHQIFEHPGAFTTYLQMSDRISNEYAGIPLHPGNEEKLPNPSLESTRFASHDGASAPSSSMPSPQFYPTLHDAIGNEHAANWGIEEEDQTNRRSTDTDHTPISESARLQQDREYWERELDVMMVFRYIRTRFKRRGSVDGNIPTSSCRPTLDDSSRRAALIRQHHPLVARAHARSQSPVQVRRSSQYSVGQLSQAAGVAAPLRHQYLRRPSSSCASQSAKRSVMSNKRILTGSSRNYWDIGSSVESGSAIAAGGAEGVGPWGEV